MRMMNHSLQNRRVMTIDEIRAAAPSVFALAPKSDVSSEYTFIPTISVLESLMAEGWQVVQADELRVRKAEKFGFQKHMLRLKNVNALKIGDSEVDMLLTNSHDRSTAYSIMAAVWRKICSNGLCVSEGIHAPVSVKHIGKQSEGIVEASYRLIAAVPKIAQSVEEMRSLILTGEQKLAFASAALVAKYGQPSDGQIFPVSPQDLLKPRRADDTSSDLYSVFNVLQENLIRGGQRGRAISPTTGQMRRTTTRAASSMDTKLNQALWTLAEELKTLTGVQDSGSELLAA